jgi:hypothetical protein
MIEGLIDVCEGGLLTSVLGGTVAKVQWKMREELLGFSNRYLYLQERQFPVVGRIPRNHSKVKSFRERWSYGFVQMAFWVTLMLA